MPAAPSRSAAATPSGAPATAAPAPAQAAALPEAQPFRFSETPSGSGAYSLGEPFSVELTVDHPAEDTYSFPVKPELKGLTLRGEVAVSRAPNAQGAETKFVVPLVNYGTVTPEVPAFTLLVNGPKGARALTVPGQKLKLRSLVSQEGEGNFEHAHHGPKPPVPVTVRSFLWVAVLGGLALVAAGLYLWRRELARRRARALAAPIVQISADEEAIARLASLNRRAPWKEGLGRQTIFEVSEIVRGYLGKRLRFDALDLTTDELLEELKKRPLPGLDLAKFSDASHWDDLVKYAKLEPSHPECAEAVERGLTLVARTRKAPEDTPAGQSGSPAPAGQAGRAGPGAPGSGPGSAGSDGRAA